MIVISIMYDFMNDSIQAMMSATITFLCFDLFKFEIRFEMTLTIENFDFLIEVSIIDVILNNQFFENHQKY